MTIERSDSLKNGELTPAIADEVTIEQYELDWGKYPYPAWLRLWLNATMDDIRREEEFIRNADAKVKAKKIIEQQFAVAGVPREFLQQPEAETLLDQDKLGPVE